MLVAALFRGAHVPLDVLFLVLDEVAEGVDDGDAVRRDHGHVHLPQAHHLTGVLQKRRDVGGDEVLSLAQADDEGAVPAQGQHAVRPVREEDAQRIGAL